MSVRLVFTKTQQRSLILNLLNRGWILLARSFTVFETHGGDSFNP